MDENNPVITIDNNTIFFEGCKHIYGDYCRLELDYDPRDTDGFYYGPHISISTYNIDKVFTVDIWNAFTVLHDNFFLYKDNQ